MIYQKDEIEGMGQYTYVYKELFNKNMINEVLSLENILIKR